VTTRNFVIATAGHVDHGKSALIKALTGTDPDRLPEEKARQITIDLGFAHLQLPAPSSSIRHPSAVALAKEELSTLSIAIVDVPGHEDFIRNMIAGVGSIDLALLVVAADDGWMPQTEEHFQILSYLGIDRAVITVTKTDLGDPERTVAAIQARLHDTAYAQSPIVFTSVHNGAGITELKKALAAELTDVAPSINSDNPRLFVDRAFSLQGIGTVVTGTLTGGSLRRGQAVIVQPRSLEARIRSVQSHGTDVEEAHPGMRTAINLPDLGVGDAAGTIKRGDVVTTWALTPSATLDVLLQISNRPRRNDASPRLLKSGASIDVHHGTARIPAKVILLRESLQVGEQAIAQLRLESPVLAYLGDRFVLRDRSQQHTLAGGIVLDPDGERARFRREEQQTLLTARAAAGNELDVCVASEIQRAGAVALTALLPKSPFSNEQIRAAVTRLEASGNVASHRSIVVDARIWRSWRRRATELIDERHAAHPEQPGLDLSALRRAFPDLARGIFDALRSDLCAQGFLSKGQIIARATHRPALPEQLEGVGHAILQALAEKPYDPPPLKQLAPENQSSQALTFLIEKGSVTKISADLALRRESLDHMQKTITDFIRAHGPATVSELRQELKSSRRVMVPLLEYLDRHGVTNRVGDRRQLAH
jgi:selenocysteine-specific elongation factor